MEGLGLYWPMIPEFTSHDEKVLNKDYKKPHIEVNIDTYVREATEEHKDSKWNVNGTVVKIND